MMKSEEVRGEVTEKLASLVRALWTLDYTPQLSVEFKVSFDQLTEWCLDATQHAPVN